MSERVVFQFYCGVELKDFTLPCRPVLVVPCSCENNSCRYVWLRGPGAGEYMQSAGWIERADAERIADMLNAENFLNEFQLRIDHDEDLRIDPHALELAYQQRDAAYRALEDVRLTYFRRRSYAYIHSKETTLWPTSARSQS